MFSRRQWPGMAALVRPLDHDDYENDTRNHHLAGSSVIRRLLEVRQRHALVQQKQRLPEGRCIGYVRLCFQARIQERPDRHILLPAATGEGRGEQDAGGFRYHWRDRFAGLRSHQRWQDSGRATV